jgi:hypothetical protein
VALILGIDAAWTEHGSSALALLRVDEVGRTVVAVAPSYSGFIGLAHGEPQTIDDLFLAQRRRNTLRGVLLRRCFAINNRASRVKMREPTPSPIRPAPTACSSMHTVAIGERSSGSSIGPTFPPPKSRTAAFSTTSSRT